MGDITTKVNSKRKGNKFEADMAFRFRQDLGWLHCWSSRFMGRLWEDSQGVDLTNTPGFNVQCKAVERLSPGYHEILASMPQDGKANLILHKRNQRGIVAVLGLDDFIAIIKRANK